MTRKVFMVAGEASGDLHAAALLQCLRRRDPSLWASGIGGRHLAEAGLEVLVRTDTIATMGLTETVGNLRRVWRAYRLARATLARERPQLVILVDYPEFNLRLARYAKSLGLGVFYYISPQVWAWRRGRIRKMRQIIDRLAVVFPFEEALYNQNGEPPFAHFVGHPLLDIVRPTRSREETRRHYGLAADRPLLALLPGSRRKEIRLLLPPLWQTAHRLAEQGWQAAIALAPTLSLSDVDEALPRTSDPFPIVRDDTYNLVHAADAALVASGTATLEVALLGKPMVIVYRVSPVTYWAGRLLIRVPHIGMPNLILGRRAAPEFLQDAVTPSVLAPALQEVYEQRAEVAAAWEQLRSRLGQPGAAERTAALVWEFLE